MHTLGSSTDGLSDWVPANQLGDLDPDPGSHALENCTNPVGGSSLCPFVFLSQDIHLSAYHMNKIAFEKIVVRFNADKESVSFSNPTIYIAHVK